MALTTATFLFPQHSNAQINNNATTKPQHKIIKIIAKEDPIYSYIKTTQENKYNFGYTTKTESPFVGADFKIIEKILDTLNIKYEFQIVPWYEIEPMLKNGDADIALSMEKTKKTLQYADFPRVPMHTQNFVFYGRKNEVRSEKITYEDILSHNYLVGITMGVTYPKEFWDEFPFEENVLNSHLEESPSYEENIRKLRQKRIDFFVADKDTINSTIQYLGLENSIYQYKNILYWQDFYCAFSKKSPLVTDKIKENIQKKLYKMKETEQLKEINAFWIQKKKQL